MKLTKRNEAKVYPWRNKMKQNFASFFCLVKQEKFCEKTFCFALFHFSQNKKREIGNPFLKFEET
jgi:hypothetical protein